MRLDGNALQCDCSVMEFVKMIKSHQQIIIAANCDSPSFMTGKHLNDVTLNELHCGEYFYYFEFIVIMNS